MSSPRCSVWSSREFTPATIVDHDSAIISPWLNQALHLRSASAADAVACARIYAPYVTGSSITFEVEPPGSGPNRGTESQSPRRAMNGWSLNGDGAVVGYAYGHRFAERAAYDWSCETSIYLSRAVHRQGVGRALYEQLLGALATRGYRRAFAGDNAPKRLKHRPAPRLRFPGCWLLPPRRLEARSLARRRVDAARPTSRRHRPTTADQRLVHNRPQLTRSRRRGTPRILSRSQHPQIADLALRDLDPRRFKHQNPGRGPGFWQYRYRDSNPGYRRERAAS